MFDEVITGTSISDRVDEKESTNDKSPQLMQRTPLILIVLALGCSTMSQLFGTKVVRTHRLTILLTRVRVGCCGGIHTYTYLKS